MNQYVWMPISIQQFLQKNVFKCLKPKVYFGRIISVEQRILERLELLKTKSTRQCALGLSQKVRKKKLKGSKTLLDNADIHCMEMIFCDLQKKESHTDNIIFIFL